MHHDNELGLQERLVKKILVPIDGSEQATRAAEFATRLAKPLGAEILVIYAVVIPGLYTSLSDIPPDRTVIRNLIDGSEKFAHSCIKPVVEKIESQSVRASSKIVHAGTSVVNAICNTAEEEKVDLIVMGTRGMTGLRRVLLGSISGGVVAYAHCPVLVYR